MFARECFLLNQLVEVLDVYKNSDKACLVQKNFELQGKVECLISGWGNAARYDKVDFYKDTMSMAVVSHFTPNECNRKNGYVFL